MATRAMWAKRVSRWRATDLSAVEFAQKFQLNARSLRWWGWRFATDERLERERRAEAAQTGLRAPSSSLATPTSTEGSAPGVSPLTFVELESPMRFELLEVVLTNGTRLRVPADFDAIAVDRLLDVLERRR